MKARVETAPPRIAGQGVVRPSTINRLRLRSNNEITLRVMSNCSASSPSGADNVYGAERSIGGKHKEEAQ